MASLKRVQQQPNEVGALFPDLESVSVADPEERVAALLENRVEIIQEVPPALYGDSLKRPGVRGAAVPSALVEYLHLKPAVGPFKDPRVREALDLALDRDALVKIMLHGHAVVATQIVSPGVLGFDPEIPATRRDLERARRLLREAGYPEGLDLTLDHRDGRNAGAIALQLAQAGFRVRPQQSPWQDVYRRLQSGEVAFYYGGFVSATGDASQVLDNVVHSRSDERGKINLVGYKNSRLDALIEEADNTLSPRRRTSILQECLRQVREDRIYLPLFVPQSLYLLQQDVVFEPRLDLMLVVGEIGWKKPSR